MKLAPIVKYPGGKVRVLPDLRPFLLGYKAFFDPFIGGGAVTCDMLGHYAAEDIYAGDRNDSLLVLYQVLRSGGAEQVHAACEQLIGRHHTAADTRRFYEGVRLLFNSGAKRLGEEIRDGWLNSLDLNYASIQLAAQTLYLNQAGFNGLVRVNSKGESNVAMGDCLKLRTPDLSDLQTFGECFARIDLDHRDWSETISLAGPGDVVYLDPPYAEPDGKAFTDYSGTWTWDDTLKLIEAADALAARGVRVVTSQSVLGARGFDSTWSRDYYLLGSGISQSEDKARGEALLWKGPEA